MRTKNFKNENEIADEIRFFMDNLENEDDKETFATLYIQALQNSMQELGEEEYDEDLIWKRIREYEN